MKISRGPQAQVPERTARPHRGAANLFLAACCVACLTGCADSLGNAPDNPTALANVSAGAPPTDAEMARTAASFTAAATPGNAGYKIGPFF